MVLADIALINIIILYFSLLFGVLNVTLLTGLLYSYWKTYNEVKSGFTIGLLYFTSLILIQNIFITIFLVVQLFLPTITPGNIVSEFHEPHIPLFFVNLIQLVALSILFKITRK